MGTWGVGRGFRYITPTHNFSLKGEHMDRLEPLKDKLGYIKPLVILGMKLNMRYEIKDNKLIFEIPDYIRPDMPLK